MNTLHIATACLLNPQHEILLVRKKGSRFWMLPGGKLDAGETASQALQRELSEELQWQAPAAMFHHLGDFENQAANEANTLVKAQVFIAALATPPSLHIAAEIEAMQWWDVRREGEQENLAPLLREQVIPAVIAHLQHCAQPA
ncbi:NUDIX hydrolase [Comamonas sp. NoAH]|uniref:NUDIX hydrolase n=1 Tax=Comamonas halotolerans TaxID=3041496 RepID=UPI0024E17C64|nr:NUDIX domain-containing protein [Comamonas sp. NoAH]